MKPVCEHLCTHFQAAMDVLSRPWNGLLVATLAPGPLRFSEIGERITAIGDRMLSCRLKELEAQGIIARSVLPGPPVRVEYTLTDRGRGFSEVAGAIAKWGATLSPAPRTAECPVAQNQATEAAEANEAHAAAPEPAPHAPEAAPAPERPAPAARPRVPRAARPKPPAAKKRARTATAPG